MNTSVYILTNCLWLGTILAIFGIRYYAQIQQAKARLANDDAYKQIAAKAAAAQSETAMALSAIQSAMADAGARLAAVEKVLKDVG